MSVNIVSMLKYFNIHKKNKDKLSSVMYVLFAFTLILIATLISPTFFQIQIIENYLPLHMILENISIIIAVLVATIGLNASKYNISGNIVFISTIFFAVAVLDFSHLLSYSGMPTFITPSSPDKAIFFWLAARFVSTVGLLIFSIQSLSLLTSRKSRFIFIVFILILISLVHIPLINQGLITDMFFVADRGLTALKIYSEYFIIILSIITLIILWKRMREPQPYHIVTLFGAVYMIIMSEFLFTLYTNVTDLYNIMGHIYKVIAYLFIYRGIYITAIEEPYEEIKRKDEMLIAQSRHAAMGEMIGMIAHQWRQPISVISMDANNMLLDIELDSYNVSKAKEYSNGIIKQTQHLSKTIDDFRNFFNPDKSISKSKLQDIFEKLYPIIKNSLSISNVTYKTSFRSDFELDTHPRELMQVFLNIINNAKDALADNKQDAFIEVKVYEDDDYVITDICDNGKGIHKHVLPRIFDPYFSTKKKKNGTGIGLYMSKLIIEDHLNGKLEVINKDVGACFRVILPKHLNDK